MLMLRGFAFAPWQTGGTAASFVTVARCGADGQGALSGVGAVVETSCVCKILTVDVISLSQG